MARSDAVTFARAFVAKHGTDCARRLPELAPGLGLAIRDVDADAFEGALVRAAGVARGVILLNRGTRDVHRRLFTLAHELGHYVLPGHDAESSPCRARDLERFGDHVSDREIDANVFAAALTMPDEILRPLVVNAPSFPIVEELAARCGTSLTASAYRVVESSGHALALVWSEGGRVRWYRRSAEFHRAVRVDDVSAETVAADCFRGMEPPDEWVDVPATAWLYPEGLLEGATLREWTRALPRYDATLSLLLATTFLDTRHDHGDGDDGDLDPEDFGLGRRQWPGRR
jgi:hypothetical protein